MGKAGVWRTGKNCFCFSGVKGMGGCRWAVMGGQGSSGGERTELRSLVLWIWNRGTLKRVHVLCLLVLNLSSENKMDNHEGVRIENLSTVTLNSKKVLFALHNPQLQVRLFLTPGDFEKCLQRHVKPIGLISLGEKCFCVCKPWNRDSNLEAKGRLRAIVQQDSEMCWRVVHRGQRFWSCFPKIAGCLSLPLISSYGSLTSDSKVRSVLCWRDTRKSWSSVILQCIMHVAAGQKACFKISFLLFCWADWETQVSHNSGMYYGYELPEYQIFYMSFLLVLWVEIIQFYINNNLL